MAISVYVFNILFNQLLVTFFFPFYLPSNAIIYFYVFIVNVHLTDQSDGNYRIVYTHNNNGEK